MNWTLVAKSLIPTQESQATGHIPCNFPVAPIVLRAAMKTLLASVSFACAVFFASALCAADAPKKPNVLFIAIDDLRDWVGYLHHNEQTKTPNIDRLAKMGEAFTHNYCAAPVCNPSRAALMSGLRQSECMRTTTTGAPSSRKNKR